MIHKRLKEDMKALMMKRESTVAVRGMVNSLVKERDDLFDILELICDTASTEWQESDGSRKGAIDNAGERLYFIDKGIMDEAKAIVAKYTKDTK